LVAVLVKGLHQDVRHLIFIVVLLPTDDRFLDDPVFPVDVEGVELTDLFV